MLVTADLCKDVAAEAIRRGGPGNVHELWAALELVVHAGPDLIVDVGSAPAVWWAWWSVCPNVIGVADTDGRGLAAAFPGGRVPDSITWLIGRPADRWTAQRTGDQVGRRQVDVLVLGGASTCDEARALWHLYTPLVRRGGVVLLEGIADPGRPGVASFWRDLQTDEREELIGASDPDGYGVVTVPGQVE